MKIRIRVEDLFMKYFSPQSVFYCSEKIWFQKNEIKDRFAHPQMKWCRPLMLSDAVLWCRPQIPQRGAPAEQRLEEATGGRPIPADLAASLLGGGRGTGSAIGWLPDPHGAVCRLIRFVHPRVGKGGLHACSGRGQSW